MTSCSKMTPAIALADQFTGNSATVCAKGIKNKSEILETIGEGVLEFGCQSDGGGPPSLVNRVRAEMSSSLS